MHDPTEFPSECPELSTRTVLSSKLELKGCVSSGNCSPHCSLEAFVWPPGVSLYTGASWYSVKTPGHSWMKFLCSCYSTYISLHQKPVLQLPAASASLNPVVCFPPHSCFGVPLSCSAVWDVPLGRKRGLLWASLHLSLFSQESQCYLLSRVWKQLFHIFCLVL